MALVTWRHPWLTFAYGVAAGIAYMLWAPHYQASTWAYLAAHVHLQVR